MAKERTVVKNCLAMIGLIFTCLITLAIGGVLYWIYLGQPLPPQSGPSISENLFAVTPEISVVGGTSRIQKESLVPTLPPPTPRPTATPIPDPVVYRSEVMLKARRFGVALESFYQENGKVGQDASLLSDPQWQTGMNAILDELSASAQELSNISPVPLEVQALQDCLAQISPETEALHQNFEQGMRTADESVLKTAGDHLSQIQALMLQAQAEAAKAGWE
jgi:hypothetical protein